MGYFGNALVLDAAPDADKLRSLFDQSAEVVVYKHKTSPLWLVDAYKPSKREHFPFTDELPLRRHDAPEADDTPMVNAYAAICHRLSDVVETYGEREVASTLMAARLLGQSVFYFVADDEGRDMGCLATPTGVTALKARLERLAVEIDGTAICVVPFHNEETFDDDEPLSQQELRELLDIPGVKVSEPRVIEGGFLLYGNVAMLWPVGDPEAMLGIGTWDPFLNIGDDYEIVPTGSRASDTPAKSAPSQPWWKLW